MEFQTEERKKLKVWKGLIFMQLSTQSPKEEIVQAASNCHLSDNGDQKLLDKLLGKPNKILGVMLCWISIPPLREEGRE